MHMAGKKTKTADRRHKRLSDMRASVGGTIGAIAMGLVLRAMVLQTFAIPTGSMADGLMGEHWDLRCPACGYEYVFGWHRKRPPARGRLYRPDGARCPNCGYVFPRNRVAHVNGGDGVLVLNYAFPLNGPRPWDVVVFKNPQDNKENYIKRLVGLPGETIKIMHGDVFVRRGDDGPWRIRRKTDRAQKSLWHMVFDNDYQPAVEKFSQEDWQPPHWRADGGPLAEGAGWDLSLDAGRTFAFSGEGSAAIALEAPRAAFLPDYAYNPAIAADRRRVNHRVAVCHDLKLSAVFTPQADDSSVQLQLRSFEHRFSARFAADGTVELLYRNDSLEGGRWQSWGGEKLRPMKLGRGCEIELVHVDLSVAVRVDGEQIIKVADEYPEDHDSIERRLNDPARRYLAAPGVGIVGEGGQFELRHVRVMRDVHYTQMLLGEPPPGPAGELARAAGVEAGDSGWGTAPNPIKLADRDDDNLDEFFFLGDNSPASLDGRGWVSAAASLRLVDADGEKTYQLGAVHRSSLVGSAVLVYWPAGFRLPGLPQRALLPNTGKMRLVR